MSAKNEHEGGRYYFPPFALDLVLFFYHMAGHGSENKVEQN
jgi:hypothetical protein